jgi:hypothetical protein
MILSRYVMRKVTCISFCQDRVRSINLDTVRGIVRSDGESGTYLISIRDRALTAAWPY